MGAFSDHAASQPSDSTSACSITVCVAFSCLIRRIAVSAENPAHQDAQMRPDVLAQRPVDADVPADRLSQLAGDVAERLVAEHLHRAVVRLQCIVECQFVHRKAPNRSPRPFIILMYTFWVCCGGNSVNEKRELYRRGVTFCDSRRRTHVHATIIPPPSRLRVAAPVPHSGSLPIYNAGA